MKTRIFVDGSLIFHLPSTKKAIFMDGKLN